MRRAVIDVGSNSVLLTVAEWDGALWHPVGESSAVTGLGIDTKATGVLSEEGMSRTLVAVAAAFKAAAAIGAGEVCAMATMAARIASNTGEFLSRAEAQGTPIAVLSGDDEARLGLLSVAQDPMFAGIESLAMIDVGGQSTEIVCALRTESGGIVEEFRNSYPVGTLGLMSGPLQAECPSGPDLLLASALIDDQFTANPPPPAKGVPVAVGATGTNLVSIREKLPRWEPDRVHGARLGFAEISLEVARLSALNLAQRSDLIGIEPGREATLPAGALILERSLQALNADACLVSVRGWRHALISEMGD
ncbi:MAG: hypothetical protein HZC36_16980 [Armatimonadetes bacterium]|nr:hypothetical protein [Armatimonadota bacterium]